MTRSNWLKASLLISIALPGATLATAQEEDFFQRDRYTAVTERGQELYDPLPVRLGAFELEPEFRAGVGYRSNLFFQPSNNETSDGLLNINPSLRGASIWSRHQIGFEADVETNIYFSNSSENVTNFNGRAFGRLDVGQGSSITTSVFGAILREPRSAAAGQNNALEPIDNQRIGGEIAGDYEFNRLRLNTRFNYTKINFEDAEILGGNILDQDFRDAQESLVEGRADYAVNRDLAVFTRLQYRHRNADTPTPANPLDRDSNSIIAQVGTNFELPVNIRGDVAVGYQSYQFDAAQFGSLEGVSFDAQAQWFITQLTTISLNATRDVIDPGLNASAGAFRTGGALRADHELFRNILLRGQVDFYNVDFESIPRSDDRIGLNVGLLWKLNRNLYIDADYRYDDQSSDFQPFKDNRFLLSLRSFL